MPKVLNNVLLQYVVANDILGAEKALRLKASPDFYTEENKHLLEIALESNNPAMMRLLLSHTTLTNPSKLLEKVTSEENHLMLATLINATPINKYIAHEYIIKAIQLNNVQLLQAWMPKFSHCCYLKLNKRTPMQCAIDLGRKQFVDIMTNALIQKALQIEFNKQLSKAIGELTSYQRWHFKRTVDIEVAVKYLKLATTAYDAAQAMHNINLTTGAHHLRDKWVNIFIKLKDDTTNLQSISSPLTLFRPPFEAKKEDNLTVELNRTKSLS